MFMHGGIGAELGARAKGLVVLVELRLQYAQAIELGEKTSGGLADRPDRIVRVLRLPRGEILLRAGEIQVIEPKESVIQGGGCAGIGRFSGACRHTQRHNQPQGCYHTKGYGRSAM